MAIYSDDPFLTPRRTITENGFNKLLTKESLTTAPPDFAHAFTSSPGAIVMSTQEMGGAISFGHQYITVQPGQDIQVALDRVSAAGGGTVRLLAERYRVRDKDIIVPKNTHLQGEGRDNSVIDFAGTSYRLRIQGTATQDTLNAKISDLSVLASDGVAGVDIQYSQGSYLENVISLEHAGFGFHIHSSSFVIFKDCVASDNIGDGYRIDNDAGSSTQAHIEFINCVSQDNSGDGYDIITASNAVVSSIFFFGCRSNLNLGDGWEMSGSIEIESALVACFSGSNEGHGFDIALEDCSFIACTAQTNTLDGFEVSDFDNRIIGCRSEANVGGDYDIQTRTIMIGNSLAFGAAIDPASNFTTGSLTSISELIGNQGASNSTSTKIRYMKNSAGADRAAGRPVIYKNTSNTRGDEGDDPDANGDDRACGMWAEFTTNAEWGAVLQEGYTTDLKVSGTTDVAIGDLLSMQTSGPVWRKAVNGDTANAIALEAYSTDDNSGIIDALLIPPRKVGGGLSTTTAKAKAYRATSVQSISTGGSTTLVQLNAESYDPGSNFDSTTDYDFTVPTTGYYQINAAVKFNSSPADQDNFRLVVRANGVTDLLEVHNNVSGASDKPSVSGSTIAYLTANDTITLNFSHSNGSSLNIELGEDVTFMAIHLLSTD